MCPILILSTAPESEDCGHSTIPSDMLLKSQMLLLSVATTFCKKFSWHAHCTEMEELLHNQIGC